MKSFKEHLKGEPEKRFSPGEWSEPLLTIYIVLRCIVRDEADTLIVMPDGFLWQKQDTIVGELDLEGPPSNRSYAELLEMILQRDEVIRTRVQQVSASPEEVMYRVGLC